MYVIRKPRAWLGVILCATARGQDASPPESIALTLSGDRPALVREVRNVHLVQGANRIALYDLPPTLVAASLQVRALADPAQLDHTGHDLWFEVLDRERVLETLVGRRVELIRHLEDGTERLEGRLLLPPTAAGPEGERPVPLFLELADGTIQMLEDGELRIEDLPDGTWNRMRLDLLATATENGRYRFEITYLAEGLHAEPQAMARLDERGERLDLTYLLSVQNRTGHAFANARLMLEQHPTTLRHFASFEQETVQHFPVGQSVHLPARRDPQVVLARVRNRPVQARPTVFPPSWQLTPPSAVRLRLDLAAEELTELAGALPGTAFATLQVDAENLARRVASGLLPARLAGRPLSIPGAVVAGVTAERSEERTLRQGPLVRQVSVRLQSERPKPLAVDLWEDLALGERVQESSVSVELSRPGLAIFPVQVPAGGVLEVHFTVTRETP